MTDDETREGSRTAAGREEALDDHERRIGRLETWKTVEEFREKGRDRRVTLAIGAAISLGIAIASGVVVALASGGHL